MLSIVLRHPTSQDALAVAELIKNCPPLDMNSLYCNLLQCTHFSNYSILAEYDGQLVGSVTGYPLPEQPDVLFIWQVAVLEQARSQGLARHMLQHLLARAHHSQLRYIETTITADNHASWQLFKGWAHSCGWEQHKQLLFDSQHDFGGTHPSEYVLRLGPISGSAGTA